MKVKEFAEKVVSEWDGCLPTDDVGIIPQEVWDSLPPTHFCRWDTLEEVLRKEGYLVEKHGATPTFISKAAYLAAGVKDRVGRWWFVYPANLSTDERD